MQRGAYAAIALAATLCVGCTRIRATLRYAVAADNQNVHVVESDWPTANCESFGPVTVIDGYPCIDCTNAYDGDPKRALRRLKNLVAMRGGNTLKLEEINPDSMITHAPGSSIRARGIAYRCSATEWRASLR